MKLLSFNVNGVRAAAGKTLIEDLHELDCDVVGLQETKATPEQVKEAIFSALNLRGGGISAASPSCPKSVKNEPFTAQALGIMIKEPYIRAHEYFCRSAA